MKIIKKIFLGLAVFAIVVVLGSVYGLLYPDRKRDRDLFIEISGNRFFIEVADTPIAQARGLSGRDQLEIDRGMLFLFPDTSVRSFWMAGMKFPLDIIWIKDGVVTGISRNLPPATAENMQITSSPGAVNMVLEINAGLASKLGIEVGDSVLVAK